MTGFSTLLRNKAAKAAGLVLASSVFLAGCVPSVNVFPGSDTPPTSAPIEPLPEAAALLDPTLYDARQDGKFSIPALPIEKIPEAYRRQTVSYVSAEAPGTIIIDPTQKFLYFILNGEQAIRYGISVGAEGFQWSGTSIVANKRHWPTWTPPAAMIERKPSLEKWRNGQPGGPTNPLGSRAIYLTTNGIDYGYRIHGTPEWRSIGRNASSGCFRMINQDVMDLYERVQGGAKVVVLTASGEYPTKLSIPPSPKPKKAETKPETRPEVVTEDAILPATGAPIERAPLDTLEQQGSNTAAPGAATPSTAPSTATATATAPESTTAAGAQTPITLPSTAATTAPQTEAISTPAAVTQPTIVPANPSTSVVPSAPTATAAPVTVPPGAVCFGEACPTP